MTQDRSTAGFRAAGLAEVCARAGEIGAMLLETDWSQTAMGPPEAWPRALHGALRIALTSRYAMWIAWGPELVFLCNEAYRPLLGLKQRWALGRPVRQVWPEIWSQIGPRLERVLETGEASWDEALPLFLERSGYLEETYHTFSYSPLVDDAGQVAGILCVITEETERVIEERRLTVLRELASGLASARTREQVFGAVEGCLEPESQDLPFTLTYLFDEPQDAGQAPKLRLISSTGGPADASPELDRTRWPLPAILEVLETGQPKILTDPGARFADLPTGPWDRSPTEVMVVPLAPQGMPRAGVMIAGLNPYRPVDEDYERFVSLFAAQVAAGLANVRVYEEGQRRAEGLAALDRAKTAFFSNVSHEFRTPLTLMLGPIDDLLDGELPGPARERLALVYRNGQRLLKLVNALLDFSRLEAGREQGSFEPTDLARFTRELASVFRGAVERAGLALTIDCPPLPEPVFVDREMWEKIVLNLLSNAFKFTFEGEIAVSQRARGGFVELDVRDTGIGIPREHLPRLFERFHRVEGARGRTHEGTGIGLALAQELVGLHGGAITVESELGRGTTFRVSLPLGSAHLPAERISGPRTLSSTATDAAAFVEEAQRWLPCLDEPTMEQERQPLPPRLEPAPTGLPRVLLADDNGDMREYVRDLLSADFEVMTARDGHKALAAARACPPDLVLTDVMMPNLDGFGLLAALRQDERTASIPVIMISARAGEEAKVEGLQAGADDYLIKPFSARELLARVHGTLALVRLRRDAARREAELTAQTACLLDSIREGFATLDQECRLTYVNHEAARTLRCSEQAVLGRTLWEVVPEIAGSELEERLSVALRAQQSVQFETWFAPWGRWFETHLHPVQRGPGERGGVVTFFRDITERRRTEAILAGQAQALQLAVDGAPLGQILEVLTNSLEEASKDSVASILLLAEDGVHLHHGAGPSLPPAFVQALEGAPVTLLGGTPSEWASEPAWTDIATSPAWTELRELALQAGLRSCWSTPIRSSQGKVLGRFVVYTAASQPPDRLEAVGLLAHTAAVVIERELEQCERRAVEGALRESEARFRQMADHAPVMIWVTGADGSCTLLNRPWYEFTGQTEAAARGFGWLDALHPDDRQASEQIFRQASQHREPFRLEYRLRRRDGVYRWAMGTACPRVDASGRFVGYIGSVIDITDRKLLEERRESALSSERAARAEAERVNRMKDEFLATLSHELRTPLNAILGWAQLLNRGRCDGAATRQGLDAIERNARLQTQMIEDLIDMSRIISGKLRLELQAVDLADIVEQSLLSVTPAAEAKGVELVQRVRLDEPAQRRVSGDPGRLQQILWNLLGNAIKFTPRGGRVEVELAAREEELEIVVSDTGRGIDADFLPHVFDRFRQADSSATRHHAGLGLGLSIVKQLAELHGGSVTASSPGAGQGATFVVRLPQRLNPQARQEARPVVAPPVRSARSPGSS